MPGNGKSACKALQQGIALRDTGAGDEVGQRGAAAAIGQLHDALQQHKALDQLLAGLRLHRPGGARGAVEAGHRNSSDLNAMLLSHQAAVAKQSPMRVCSAFASPSVCFQSRQWV